MEQVKFQNLKERWLNGIFHIAISLCAVFVILILLDKLVLIINSLFNMTILPILIVRNVADVIFLLGTFIVLLAISIDATRGWECVDDGYISGETFSKALDIMLTIGGVFILISVVCAVLMDF